MSRGFPLLAAMLVLGASTPAYAQGSIQIPEPTDLLLFSMGVLGLIVGRQFARKKPPQD